MSTIVVGSRPTLKEKLVGLTSIKHPSFCVCSIVCTSSDGLGFESKQKACKSFGENKKIRKIKYYTTFLFVLKLSKQYFYIW